VASVRIVRVLVVCCMCNSTVESREECEFVYCGVAKLKSVSRLHFIPSET